MMLIGAVAFCLGFTALYAAVTRDLGLYFWILTAAGAFFLPMLLLACTLFGGAEALKPALIVASIAATLPAVRGRQRETVWSHRPIGPKYNSRIRGC